MSTCVRRRAHRAQKPNAQFGARVNWLSSVKRGTYEVNGMVGDAWIRTITRTLCNNLVRVDRQEDNSMDVQKTHLRSNDSMANYF